WDILGEKRAPNIVFEHPGETTIPTSVFVCDTGGMVVICAGTTGYNATVDLRYLWMRQKRVQGSHFANGEQSDDFNKLVLKGQVDPCMSKVVGFDEIPDLHQLMYENKHPHGNMAVLVNAKDFGMGISSSAPQLTSISSAAGGDNVPPDPFPISSPSAMSSNMISEHMDDIDLQLVDDGTLVKDLMHAGLISCTLDTTLEATAKIMIDNDIHAVVVMDGDRAVGVVSQTDMVLARQGRSAEDARKLKASEIMTPDARPVTPASN
ncbi:MAG: zinc-binding dehydrogenase, partial [Candidatus Competibacteraceae bacterium]|nr:zinc-binding dehydrogenase [Candidatus Competibacteraceae bacterium]